MGLAVNVALSQECDGVYAGLVERDAPLGVSCPNAGRCWGRREDPHRTCGTIFAPWIGAGYRHGGVCVVGLNLRVGRGAGTYWEIERNVAAKQHAALSAGRLRSQGSRWASATMRDAALVRRQLDGRDLDEAIGPVELARTLERTARVQAVKCSPGMNRGTPSKAMTVCCPQSYLSRELAVLRPGVLLVYGAAASAAVRRAGVESDVERRGQRFRRLSLRFQEWSCTVFVLTHPAHSGWPADHRRLRESVAEASITSP